MDYDGLAIWVQRKGHAVSHRRILLLRLPLVMATGVWLM